MRLPGENPDRSQVDPFELDPDPLTWKRVAMVGTLETGETLETELLRPKEWFDDHQIHVGKFLPLAISEIGRITGVTVTEITRCPPIEPGEGNVCTGRFKRLTPELVRIDLKDANESLFTTGPHPIWSDTDGVFINAEHMTDPQTVRTELGPDTAQIGQVVKRTTVVYNIETHAEHVYLAGLLVHNADYDPVRGLEIVNGNHFHMIDDLLRAGAQADRNGLTLAGRALQKHGDRIGSVFPKSVGDLGARNAQGQSILNGILRSTQQLRRANRHGGFDVFDSVTGQGARFDGLGNFIGFLDP